MNTDPAPLVSQLPDTVQEPDVSVIVPEVPPVIVTFETLTVAAFDVRMPLLPRLMAPPIRPRLTVASSVVLDASPTVNAPPHRSALVAIVNVCAVPADEANRTSLNSFSIRLVPPNVIVPPVAESNRTVPVPASQTALSVEELDHVPLMVQISEPNVMAEEADEIPTFPDTAAAPDVLVRSPPLIVRFPLTVKVLVFLSRVPPEMVRPVAVNGPPRVRVPPETVTEANVEPDEIVKDPVPENVTDELVAVKLPEGMDAVSQDPVLIVIAAEANVRTAAPKEVRLLAPKATVALVIVIVPENVKLATKVVLIPLSTVKLFAVSSMLIVPPEVSTSTVDVPTA